MNDSSPRRLQVLKEPHPFEIPEPVTHRDADAVVGQKQMLPEIEVVRTKMKSRGVLRVHLEITPDYDKALESERRVHVAGP